jgi:hypothetical protein
MQPPAEREWTDEKGEMGTRPWDVMGRSLRGPTWSMGGPGGGGLHYK